MNIFTFFEHRVADAIQALVAENRLPAGLNTGRIVVEPPRDSSYGDLATNAAMVLAKDAKINPRALAEMIAEKLDKDDLVVKVDIAGPGFINLTLVPEVYHRVLLEALNLGADFGRGNQGQGKAINVEYVSANPTGPMHVGHGRGAVFGDALAGVLSFAGYNVTREYYINDAGAQVDVLARSAYLRYREALGEAIEIPEGLYPGDYLVPVGQQLADQHGKALLTMDEQEWLPIVRDFSIDAMMAMIRQDLAMIGIKHDVFFSERSLTANGSDMVRQMMDDLRNRGLIYEGRLPPPKGQLPEDWEDREQTLFRSSDFGDDVDRPLMKSDGTYTYFASDIAYHYSKYTRGFSSMIDVLGADHGGYVKRMQSAVKAITGGKGELDAKLCQLVRLLRNGQPVKMSKRAGEFITLREVVEEVGPDAVRFMMVFRKNDSALDFDLAKVVEMAKENPVFYVQYAHARCASVLREASRVFPSLDLSPASLSSADLTVLKDASEIDLFRRISQYPRMVEAAAANHEPHRIAFYLYELASDLNSLWNKGKDLPQLRFINQDDERITSARLVFVRVVRDVLASGLAILGVSAPEEMR